MIDPARLGLNTLKPPVHVEQVVADRKNYSPQDGLRLPPRTRDLEIDYTALSFVAPQKVRFRYQLEGRDDDWQDAQGRRQVFYSDLAPGSWGLLARRGAVWTAQSYYSSFVSILQPPWWAVGSPMLGRWQRTQQETSTYPITAGG